MNKIIEFEIADKDLSEETINSYDFAMCSELSAWEITHPESQLKWKKEIARLKAEYLVDGWRLPNLEELKKMFSMARQLKKDPLLYKDIPGYDFKDDWYMTSECPNMIENMCVHYGDRREVVRKTEESHWGCCYIRLIKDK